MIWMIVQVKNIVEYIKEYLRLDYVPKFTRSTMQYISGFMGKAVRCQREIVTKRLRRRKKRRLNDCKQSSKAKSSTCVCRKCTRTFRYVQKERVIEPDFLANLAYNQRVSRNNETSMDGYNEPVGEITLSPGETWWKKVVTQRSNMPPLYRGPLTKPTKSEYSSATSGFRSATPDIFSDAIEPSRSVTPLSVNTDKGKNGSEFFSSPSDGLNFFPHLTEGSKSDSKILSPLTDTQSRIETRMTTRSISNNIVVPGTLQKKGPASTILTRRYKGEQRKKMTRTTSHGSDCFSTCAKCSRILSKAV